MEQSSDKYISILHEYWGYPSFRGIQREIIDSIASGRDTLGLMPTGGGKSITFQVPALAMDGVCIVITPLIALMKDQVHHLRQRGIIAAMIHSGMSRHEILVTLENCILGNTKILYVSPERIASELFKVKVQHMNVCFITVDEAHCISQWGYDFRPAYLHIADIRRLKPTVPVLALTATATPRVVEDIQEKLCFNQSNVFKMSFERKNLVYVVRNTSDKMREAINILRAVSGTSIVYTRSRRRTKEFAEMLNDNGISASFYHAGLEHTQKDERQRAWNEDKIRVIVATNAFGMGIDKPDVRSVIHIDAPSSLEAYFQEAGRAGRDGATAYAVLLFSDSDKRKLSKRISDEFPDKEYIKRVYEDLASYYQIGVGYSGGHTYMFQIDKFCVTFGHFPTHVHSSLKILQRAGYIEYETDPDIKARLMFLLNRDDLYRFQTLTPKEELVVTALLRSYGGLFSNYCYIDEGVLAKQTGLDVQQVYMLLKGMNQQHIIHFIPQQKTPYITYARDRVETDRLVIPPEVYEQRKQQYADRIDTVIKYATNDMVCRSRQLLRYFDETKSCDCGRCDVCVSHNGKGPSVQRLDEAQNAILQFLGDKKRHRIDELRSLQLPKNLFCEALDGLVEEEKVRQEDGQIFL